MTTAPMVRAPLRHFAPRTITADELLWTDHTGFCTVFPEEHIGRTSQLRIDGATASHAIETLRRLFDNPGYASAPISFARLNGVFVDTSLGVAATRDGILIEETAVVAQAIDPSLAAIHDAVRDGRSAIFRDTEQTPVLHCFHRATPAYGHFIFDGLSVIAWFRDAILAERIKVLFPPFFPAWGLDILASLGLDRDRHMIRPGESVVFCHEIVIPTIIQTANTFFPNRAFCTGLHDAIVEASGARKRPARTRHIYLSRMNQINYSNRSIDNEDAVRRTLASMGFAILEPGNMPFTAQIAAFNDAAVIVGGHGSTFGNLIAARPGATVVDLMPESWIGFWDKPEAERWVLHMTTLFGLDYLPILCCSELIDRNESDDATARRAKGMHYEVDLNLLKRVVGRAQDQDYQARDG